SNLVAHIPTYRADVRERYAQRSDRQRAEYLEWVRSVGSWQLALDQPLLACAAEPQATRPGGAPSLGHVVRGVLTAACRICALLPLIDHHGSGAKVRGLVRRHLQAPSPAAPLRGATTVTSAAPTGAPGMAARRTGWQRVVGHLITRTLRPCDRHHLLR